MTDQYDEELEAWRFDKHTRRQFMLTTGGVVGSLAAGPLVINKALAAGDLLASEAKKANLPYKANTSVKGNISFWHHWASPLRHTSIRSIIKQFNQYYPHVKVTDTAFPFGDVWTKNVAAEAAGSGMPDVLISNRPTLWWDAGVHHVYADLTALAKRDHVTSKPFWPFTWAEAAPKGKVFGLPYETDCRVLYGNNAMFLDNGLPANKMPSLWSQLPGFADKLDKKNGSKFDVVTFNPLWGSDLNAWPWNNSAEFQDSKLRPTLNTAKMIETGNWVKGWIDRYGKSNLDAIAASNPPARDQFSSQHAAFYISIPGQQAVWNYYGIQFIRSNGDKPFPFWGVGLLPHNTGGKSRSFSGGFSLSMPTSKHRSKGNTDATWEFIKFMTFVGQQTWATLTQAIPTVESIAKNNPILNSQPHWKIFMQAMALGHAAVENKYDVNFPGDVMGPAQDAISSGNKSVKEALDGAQSQALENFKKNGGP